jgi:predicted O-methyltransferase YrrM
MNEPASLLPRLLGNVIDECSGIAYRGLLGHAPDLLLKRLGAATPRRRLDFYTLARLVRTKDGFPGAILECGTHHGATLLGMAHILRSRGISARLYGLDSFEGFPEPTAEDAQGDGTMHPWVRRGFLGEASLERLTARIARMDLTSRVTLIKGYFDDTLPRLAAERFSLVHLDCDLYGSYMSCLEFVYPRMLPDGMIIFDDYGSPPYPGAQRAVDEFLTDRPERLQFYPEAPVRPRYFVTMGGGLAPGASAAVTEPIPEQRRAA